MLIQFRYYTGWCWKVSQENIAERWEIMIKNDEKAIYETCTGAASSSAELVLSIGDF